MTVNAWNPCRQSPSQAGDRDPPGVPVPLVQSCWLMGVDWLNHGQKESALGERATAL